MKQLIGNFKKTLFSNNSRFPLYGIYENEMIMLDGQKSFMFSLSVPDLEQLDSYQILSLYTQKIDSLNTQESDFWYKFYHWNNKTYLCSNNKDIPKEFGQSEKLLNPMNYFYKESDLYSDIDFYENYLTINNEYWRIIHVETPPNESYESFLSSYKCDYILAFKKLSHESVKTQLSHKRRSQGVTLNTQHQNHEGEAAYDEANRILRNVLTKKESLFKVSLMFIVKEQDHTCLNEKTQLLINKLKQNGARAFVETSGIDYFFTKTLFGVPPSFVKGFQSEVGYLSNLIPNHQDKLHEKGLDVYSCSAKPLYLDLFDPNSINQNWLITGSSGQGKSFLAGALLYDQFTNSEVKIGIFDLGGSLKRVAKYLGAKDLSATFNPLQFRDPHYLKNFILSVVGSHELSRVDKGKLFDAINNQLDNGINSFKKLIQGVSKEISGIEYYFSELWEYFDDSVITVSDIFYFDIENRPEELVGGYLVFAKELIENEQGRTISFFDECWNIFDKCPEILREKAKTSRKKLNANIFITQEIVELAENYAELSKAILANTYAKIYFNQPDLNHLILTDFEKKNIETLRSKKGQYSEFFFSSNDNKKILRYISSPLLFELCNSEKENIIKQQNYINSMQDILSYPEAMERWVELKWGRGM